jgi:predicted permease
MNDILNNIIPLIMTFAIGHLLYRYNFLTRDNADLFLKLFFYLALPAVILLSIPSIPLTHELIFFPLIAILIFVINLILAWIASCIFKLEAKTKGVFLIGTIIFNGSFAYPFVMVSYHEEAMAGVYLYDFGNAIVTFSIAYYLACRYGQNGRKQQRIWLKFFKSPPLVTLIVAIFLNLSGIPIPNVGENLLRIFSGLLTPLIMLSLGIYFNPRIVRAGPLATVVTIQIIGGLIFGYLFSHFFGLHGVNQSVVQIMAICPAAMNTLAYAAMEGLDKEFAASIVSYTTIISIVFIPLMILILQ